MQPDSDIMRDMKFWSRLEYAASGWLAASTDAIHRKYWIDGFVPEAFNRSNAGAEIQGKVAMVGHRSYEDFRFVTCMPWRVVIRGRESFEIEQIVIDEEAKLVEIIFRATLKKPDKPPAPTPEMAGRHEAGVFTLGKSEGTCYTV